MSKTSKCRKNRGRFKVKHATREEAEEHLQVALNQVDHPHAMEVYKCIRCGFWHVGRKPADPEFAKQRWLKKHDPNHYDVILVGKLIGILRGTYPGRSYSQERNPHQPTTHKSPERK